MRLVVAAPGASMDELSAGEVGPRGGGAVERFDADGRALAGELVPRAPLAVSLAGEFGFRWTLPEPVVLEPGETRRLDLDPGSFARLVVTVIDTHGAPAGDVELWLTRRPSIPAERGQSVYFQYGDEQSAYAKRMTNHEGLAVFEQVAPGAWWIGPARTDTPPPEQRDAAVAAVARPVELHAGEFERKIDLTVERGAYLFGRVVDPSGRPIPRATVGCEHETLAGYLTADVLRGEFVLGPVAGGVHLVRAVPHGVYLAPPPARAIAGDPPLEIVLVQGCTLAGTVVDAASGAGVRADLACGSPELGEPKLASIGDDGRFELTGVEAGTYCILARTRDGRAGMTTGIALSANASRSESRIEVSAATRLTVRRRGGGEHATVELRVGRAALVREDLPDGVSREWSLPAGSWELALLIGTDPPTVRAVETRLGATAEVVFELE